MTGIEVPALTVVPPGQGQVGDLGTIGVEFKLWGRDTGGQVAIVEHPFPVGAIVPAHLHTREDEYSIVTEGEIGFRSGDREVVLGPGGYITKPRGEVHTMWNAGKEPARMIEVITPAGFEEFFHAMTELVAAGPPPTPKVMELAEAYGLELHRPEWMDGLIDRYGLRDPFA
ncbi:MAG: cupin domain-containing protein [Hamadaea sp.]|uniref:cupin domain-containing protein n=1 Tax=Hamadaea sp. TaxID=2024425 RepID=UPI0017EE97C8|nr:cupin domain-containing protein [Hamadaea sp.]NUT20831.1 cupin domain-containing protein [Hamadaea sp.]